MKLVVLLLFVSATAMAQSGPRFAIVRSVVAGGGATFSAGPRFQAGTTVAQPAAADPANARFSIWGGFWIWPAPVIFACGKTGSSFVLGFASEPGKTYAVSYADSLVNPVWQNLPTITGDGTVKTVTNAAPGVAQRFFMLIER